MNIKEMRERAIKRRSRWTGLLLILIAVGFLEVLSLVQAYYAQRGIRQEAQAKAEGQLNAAHSDIANKYILLTDSEHLRLVMHQAKRILGDRVSVVVANSHEEQIYAVRAFFPDLSMEENTAQMREAVRKMAKE